MSQVVAVQGVDFSNKGAELMLRAIVHHMQGRDVILATDLGCGNHGQRSRLGLYHLPWLFIGRIPANVSFLMQRIGYRLTSTMPQALRDSQHTVRERDIGAVLDASGFCYSDQTGIPAERRTQLAAKNIVEWKKQGKKIVLLPQAFGPFENQRIAEYVTQIVDHSDLVFARDTLSYSFLLGLPVNSTNIRMAPDFTSTVPGVRPEYFTRFGRPCVIPNYRMVDRTSSDISENYPKFLIRCLDHLSEQHMDPFILVHEERDIAFAASIQRQIAQPIEVVIEPDPVFIKGILATCSFVISSRYHGLVSALSQNVPGLATSWSHKYQMLLEDYKCPDCLLSVTASDEEILQRVGMVSKGDARANLLATLQKASSEQSRATLEMWEEVDAVLGTKS